MSVVAVVLSGVIETVQFFMPGRDASMGDVLFNGVGTLGGGLLAPRLSSVLGPATGRAEALCLTWGASFGLGLGLLAWLVGQDLSLRTLRLELLPPAPDGGFFEGSLLSQTVDRVLVDDGAFVEWPEDGTGAAAPRIGIRFTNGPSRVAFRPIVGLAENDNQPVLLGPAGEDLILRLRRPADPLRLTPADLRLVGAFAGARAGDTISASFWREGNAYCLQLDERRECGLGFTVGSGWALLLPNGWGDGSRDRWLDGIWLALLILPLGYWSRSGRATWVAIGCVILPAAALPVTTSLLAAPVSTFGGLGLGWAAGRLASRLGLRDPQS